MSLLEKMSSHLPSLTRFSDDMIIMFSKYTAVGGVAISGGSVATAYKPNVLGLAADLAPFFSVIGTIVGLTIAVLSFIITRKATKKRADMEALRLDQERMRNNLELEARGIDTSEISILQRSFRDRE